MNENEVKQYVFGHIPPCAPPRPRSWDKVPKDRYKRCSLRTWVKETQQRNGGPKVGGARGLKGLAGAPHDFHLMPPPPPLLNPLSPR